MKKSHSSKKTSKLRGVAKLEDANDAGTKNSIDCTLILTEGDSAKTLAVAGLSVIGRLVLELPPEKEQNLNYPPKIKFQGQVRRVPAEGQAAQRARRLPQADHGEQGDQ